MSVSGAIKKGYEAQKQAEQYAFEQAKTNYENQKTDVVANAEDLAKQVYTQKMVQEKTLPNVLQQAGLATGGYAESTANRIGTTYQNAWNGVMKDKTTGLQNIDRAMTDAQYTYQQRLAGLEGDYQSNMANYYASLRSSGTSGGGTDPTTFEPGKAKTYNDVLAELANTVQLNAPKDENGLNSTLNDLDYILANYVKKGIITQTQRDAIYNQYKNQFYNMIPRKPADQLYDGAKNYGDFGLPYTPPVNKATAQPKATSTGTNTTTQTNTKWANNPYGIPGVR